MRDGLNKAAACSGLHPAATGTGYHGRPTSGCSKSNSAPAEPIVTTEKNKRKSARQQDKGAQVQTVGSAISSLCSTSGEVRHKRKQTSSSVVEGAERRKACSQRGQTTSPTNDPDEQRTVTAAKVEKVDNQTETSKPSYWHYKQTGIKSRPIKLLKHPIEHIERKIILTYLLGFLFKFIAIVTGPLTVLIVFLITVPFVVLRRTIWFVLNWLFDARIKTLSVEVDVQGCQKSPDDVDCFDTFLWGKISSQNKLSAEKLDKQVHWHYCPFNYLETYWFKEKLINNVIMLIDHQDHGPKFSINKLQCLVRDQILAKPIYRKFLSRVVKRGFPLYKSYYWHYLDLFDQTDDDCGEILTRDENFNLDFIDVEDEQQKGRSFSSSSTVSERNQNQTVSSSSCEGQLLSSIATKTAHDSVRIAIPEAAPTKPSHESNGKLQLGKHIFLDGSLGSSGANRSTICHYARQLIGTKLDMSRPLWEIRLVPASTSGKSYLIFRCHQSLADGKSLSRILTSNLTLDMSPSEEKCKDDNNLSGAQIQEDEEYRLSLVKEKPSFVENVSKRASWKSAILVGPLTVLLWFIWTFTRRKNNHLNKRFSISGAGKLRGQKDDVDHRRRFHMAHYSLTKVHQIKQMTRSTVSDVILCSLSGSLREYLRKFNGVTNPPNLQISLAVDMSQKEIGSRKLGEDKPNICCDESRGFSHSPQPITGVSETTPCSDNTTIGLEADRAQSEVAPKVNCTLVNVPLPTSVEGTVPRLWEMRNTMDELRTSADPWVMLGLQQFLFYLMPVSFYQWLINCIALRNSSTIVSNIRGPQNLVEAWCVDLLQRAILESQQGPRTVQTDPNKIGCDEKPLTKLDEERLEALRVKRRQMAKMKEVKFLQNLGSISEIYYCMQPPTSDIPISFNCITYHDKLFISTFSRTLLVEDSKLLIQLFIRQLDQLANTIAKRRSLVTIIRTPIPIEISCQPASPQSSTPIQSPVTLKILESLKPDDTDEIGTSIDMPYFEQEPAEGNSAHEHQDDFGANLESRRREAMCKNCEHQQCTCKRRRSLFSLDLHQRQHNLLSLLIPTQLMGSRSPSGSRSPESVGQNGQSPSPIECLCGQRLLEELDEEGSELFNGKDNKFTTTEIGAAKADTSRSAQVRVASGGAGGGDRLYCARCRLVTKRSTLSLNDDKLHAEYENNPLIKGVEIENGASSSDGPSQLNRDRSRRTTNSSAQLSVLGSERIPPKTHSKSETDLLPTNKSDKIYKEAQRGTKESWFTMGRLAKFPKSSQSSQRRSMSSRASANQIGNSRETDSKIKQRNLIEMPTGVIDTGYKHNTNHQQFKRRRQSVATTTGVHHIHRSVVVKDKINNDVSLRLDSPFLGIKNRRFSVIGNAVVESQRRGSLLPFGLIQNQSLPKLFWDDGEAHL